MQYTIYNFCTNLGSGTDIQHPWGISEFGVLRENLGITDGMMIVII